MIDIKEGDYLVLGGVTYPVKSVATWSGKVSGKSLYRMATEVGTTKRTPDPINGVFAQTSDHLVDLSCLPVMPVDSDTRRRVGLESPVELCMTFVIDTTGIYLVILEELKV